MALATTYGEHNYRSLEKVIVPTKPTGRVVTNNEGWSVYAKSITEERYQYFGMTEAAADTCLSELVALSAGNTTYSAVKVREGNSEMFHVNVTKTTIQSFWDNFTTTTEA